MKDLIKTWMIATVSASMGIALGMVLTSNKKGKSCPAKGIAGEPAKSHRPMAN